MELFKDKLKLNIVAEDLGFIDEGVRLLLQQTNYPGMKVLESAFDGNKDIEHNPSNYNKNFVCYTGTHDNMPLYQYILDLDENSFNIFYNDLKEEANKLNINIDSKNKKTLCHKCVELAFASKANTCIIPIQDWLKMVLLE